MQSCILISKFRVLGRNLDHVKLQNNQNLIFVFAKRWLAELSSLLLILMNMERPIRWLFYTIKFVVSVFSSVSVFLSEFLFICILMIMERRTRGLFSSSTIGLVISVFVSIFVCNCICIYHLYLYLNEYGEADKVSIFVSTIGLVLHQSLASSQPMATLSIYMVRHANVKIYFI